MASLRDTVKDYQEELRDGIAWVAFWKTGRSWNAEYFHLEMGDYLYPEDRSRMEEIKQADPAAVVVNGYYSGYLGEDMNLDELTAGVRRHYENGYSNIGEFIEAHDDRLPPELIEEARAAAHAAGLPFSEKAYRDGEEPDPYLFDGSMSIEDYELMHRMIENERSERMAETILSGYEAAAKRAKDMNSFSDYKQGSATAEYRHYVDEAVQLAERQKQRVDPMYHEKIDSLLDTYARKLAANMNKGYEIDARVPSILIAGGSNFPTRKKEKQNAARDSNYREWQDIQGLLDKIRSTGMGGISADDPQAVQKLEKKLENLEKSQETMKAVNAYYRKHKTLDGCPHLSPEQLEKLKADMASSWHLGDKPFATWALSNNSAEIRRVKDRIKSLSQQKEIGFVGWEFDGGKVEANTEANRLQIFFEDKPDEATREALKSNGFRWSPKAGAWQRQLTSNAYYAADYIKAIAPFTGEKPTELQRAHIRAQKEAAQKKPEQEAIYKVYRIEDDVLVLTLARTGTHSDLFGK